MRILPIFTSSTYFEYVIDLDGADWVLRFRWSSRFDTWYLDVFDADEQPVALGVRLVLGVDLLATYPGAKPAGMLAVITLDKTPTDPGFGSFDRGHRLVYFEAADIEAVPPPSLRIYDAV